MQVKPIDRVKFLIMFWAVTLPVLPYFLALAMIAVLNPLWFRDDMLRFVQRHTEAFGDWRSALLEPVLLKYKLFDIIKTGRTSEPSTS
jgi:hypothetical protein